MSLTKCCSDDHKDEKEKENKQEGEWQCSVCTVINKQDQTQCDLCQAKKRADTTSLRQRNDDKDNCPGKTEDLKDKSLSDCSGSGHKCEENTGPRPEGEWQCLACTTMNKEGQSRCDVCKTKKGTKTSPLRQTYLPWKDDVEFCSEDTYIEQERRIVVIGTSRDAKVKVANLLLGEQMFHSTTTSNRCEVGSTSVRGCSLLAVYAPAMFDPNVKEEAMSRELWRMVSLAAPGPHVFLFVVDNKETEDDQRAIQTLAGLFGENVWKATVRVVVGTSESTHSSEQMPTKFCMTVRLTNSSSSQQGELLKGVAAVMKKNEKSYFKHALFAEVELILQQQRSQQIHEDGAMKKLKALEEDFRKLKLEREDDAEKLKKLKSEIRKRKAQLKEREEKLREKERKWLSLDDKTLDQIITAIKEIGGRLLPVALNFFYKRIT